MENNGEKKMLDYTAYGSDIGYMGGDIYKPLIAESYMENPNDSEGQAYVFNLSRFLKRCLKKIWILLIMVVVFAVVGAAYGKLSYKPSYSTRSTFVINVFRKVSVSNNEGESVVKVSSDTTTANSVISNLKVLILSDKVISMALEANPDINVDIETVKSIISISNVSNTSIMVFSAKHEDPKVAYDVINAITDIAPVALKDIVSNGELTLIDKATMPTSPTTTSNTSRYAAIGAGAAVIIFLGVIFLLDFMSSTIKDAKDAERSIGKRVLGVIPDNKKFRKKVSATKETGILINDHSCGFSYIEAFKSMRIKFENLCLRHKYKSVLITSTQEHEGKTTIAINLALSLAKKKYKVLLVECDLRRPNLFYMLGLSDLKYGILDVIEGVVPYKEAITFNEEYGVYGLFSRRSVNDATERLGSDAMRDLILSLEADRSFDFIIYDAPPSLMMTDAELLTRYVDGVIMIVKEDLAQLHDIKNTISKLSNEKAVVLGTVLNAAKKAEKRAAKRA